MRRIGYVTIAILGLLAASTSNAVPAFPEAQGFGAQTEGGRGGVVFFVTNLDDCGEGSLRQAIDASGPRIVVFRVGGTITLESPLVIANPYITIAGQTAPGDGIQIRNNPDGTYALGSDSFPSLYIRTHDVVLRYLRIRPGQLEYNPDCDSPNPPASTEGPTCQGTDDILGIHIQDESDNVVIDHASIAWADHDLIFIGPATNVTVQESIIAEGLDYALYDPTPNSFYSRGPNVGAQIVAQSGLETGRVTFHNNFLANIAQRTPSLNTYCFDPNRPQDCVAEAENNVVYNWRTWGSPAGFGTLAQNAWGHHFSNIVSNYYKEGPELNPSLQGKELKITDWKAASLVPDAMFLSHIEGNQIMKLGGAVQEAAIECRVSTPNLHACTPEELSELLAATPIAPSDFTPEAAESAVNAVLADAGDSKGLDEAGNWVAHRDSADARVVSDFWNGTGSVISDEAEFMATGRWPTLASGTPPTDTDADGMPDLWEVDQCLDPQVADGTQDADGDVYTNIEEYLNGTEATVDPDADGVHAGCDNCPVVANANQDDSDSDGVGDVCDNCPTVANADQADRDGDQIGNVCDPESAVFESIAAEDGWTLQLNQNSSSGGSHNSAANGDQAVLIGDQGSKKQYRSILSFDTSSLDDEATVVGATVTLTNGTTNGGNTSGFGTAWVDVRSGGFNGSVSLEDADFEAPSTAAQAGSLNTGGATTSATLNSSGLAAVNTTGRTQLKIRFNLATDGDSESDYVGYYSSDNGSPANHPTLAVQYILP